MISLSVSPGLFPSGCGKSAYNTQSIAARLCLAGQKNPSALRIGIPSPCVPVCFFLGLAASGPSGLSVRPHIFLRLGWRLPEEKSARRHGHRPKCRACRIINLGIAGRLCLAGRKNPSALRIGIPSPCVPVYFFAEFGCIGSVWPLRTAPYSRSDSGCRTGDRYTAQRMALRSR